MPIKRIGDYPECNGWILNRQDREVCHDPNHYPSERGLSPGIYEYTCPTCGKVQEFTVYPKMTMGAPPRYPSY